ncbi:MAG: hypothetical protein QMD21_00700 [Candidatus Thermoplasmatota archaeon]|nr:hypothetical protein [Candidatus Thermoplasmatota archaeon]
MVSISPGMKTYGDLGRKLDARKPLLESKMRARIEKSKLKWQRRIR